MKYRHNVSACFVCEDANILTAAVGRPKPVYGSSAKPSFRDNLFKQIPRIRKQLSGSRSKHLVLEDVWIDTLQLPCMKERRPVDERHQRRQWEITQHANT